MVCTPCARVFTFFGVHAHLRRVAVLWKEFTVHSIGPGEPVLLHYRCAANLGAFAYGFARGHLSLVALDTDWRVD